MKDFRDSLNDPIHPSCLAELTIVPAQLIIYYQILKIDLGFLPLILAGSILAFGAWVISSEIDTLTTLLALKRDSLALESEPKLPLRPTPKDLIELDIKGFFTLAVPMLLLPEWAIHQTAKNLQNSLHNLKISF